VLGCAQLVCNPDGQGILYPGLWLSFAFVEPRVRGAGLGMRLASTVIEAARAQSAPRLHLLVDRDNGRARALYEKLGFASVDFAPLRETLERLEATLGVERLVMAKDLRPPAPQTPAALR
jgi:GNAT superfamily N-acetyltransferase